MASDDIPVPDLSYFLERDLRHAICELDAANEVQVIREATKVDFACTEHHGVASSIPALDGPLETSGKGMTKRKEKRRRKGRKSGTGDGKMRQYASAWAVYSTSKQQEARAANPKMGSNEIRKLLSREWKAMSRFQRAPYQKEFENRKRLYELENPGTEATQHNSPRNKPARGFRFLPNLPLVKHFEVYRIEHLPACPIFTKQKIYEDAYATPPTTPSPFRPPLRRFYPKRRPQSTSPAMIDMGEEGSEGCTGCPKTFAVCEYCRDLGHKGDRILHFEADCRTKARHMKSQRAMAAKPSKKDQRPSTSSRRPNKYPVADKQVQASKKTMALPVSLPEESLFRAPSPPLQHLLVDHNSTMFAPPDRPFLLHENDTVIPEPQDHAFPSDLPDLADMDALLALCGLGIPSN